jgi:hypothetical protein
MSEESDIGGEFIVRNEKGAILIRLLEGRVIYYRNPFMVDAEKNFIKELVTSLTDEYTNEDIMNFLNYEGEDEFCV